MTLQLVFFYFFSLFKTRKIVTYSQCDFLGQVALERKGKWLLVHRRN